eukprot:TRINITY_DN1027_c0_g1_i1.p1 TRINITY_DN1027_c0_g1~~TRINITY_DN1027_c0_g1_i1.p1  ORF type:complete len:288 (-),score=46.80 TRINITY_DN1027_c0_g1_i1:18-881(-)
MLRFCRSGSSRLARCFSSNSNARLSEVNIGRLRASGSPRFFKQVSLKDVSSLERNPPVAGSGYCVLLDHRVLVTPHKQVLTIPQPLLAAAVAAEWDAQTEFVKPTFMPLSAICATAVDMMSSETQQKQHVRSILEWLKHDLVCYRALDPPALVKLQERYWDPIVHFMSKSFKVQLPVYFDLQARTMDGSTFGEVEKYLNSLDTFSLSAFKAAAGTMRSVSLALAMASGERSVDQAITAARVDERHQTKDWGFVQGHHDIDISYVKMHVFAAHTVMNLCKVHNLSQNK